MAFIPSTNLQASNVPGQKANWRQIIEFASTFDIAMEYSKGTQVTGMNDVSSMSAVVDLRLALCAAWRRHNHFHEEPAPVTLRQAQEVRGWIRQQLKK